MQNQCDYTQTNSDYLEIQKLFKNKSENVLNTVDDNLMTVFLSCLNLGQRGLAIDKSFCLFSCNSLYYICDSLNFYSSVFNVKKNIPSHERFYSLRALLTFSTHLQSLNISLIK